MFLDGAFLDGLITVRAIHEESLGYVVGFVAKLIHAIEEVVDGFFFVFWGFDGLIFGDDIGDVEVG